ncbi:hypothetical protein D1007_02958 [Hordeum vulgare]|nr:hypothetical protein D1007_02958 [Hordeum vulgare]
MALGVAVLVAGTSKYRYRRPAGSTSDPPRKWGMPGEDADDAVQRCCSDPDGRHGRSLLGWRPAMWQQFKLYLEGNALAGGLEFLEALVIRDMGRIGVTVPRTLSGLTRLQELYLEGNTLAGGVPGKVLSRMSSLRYLSLAGNRLEGTLSPELSDIGIQGRSVGTEHRGRDAGAAVRAHQRLRRPRRQGPLHEGIPLAVQYLGVLYVQMNAQHTAQWLVEVEMV